MQDRRAVKWIINAYENAGQAIERNLQKVDERERMKVNHLTDVQCGKLREMGWKIIAGGVVCEWRPDLNPFSVYTLHTVYIVPKAIIQRKQKGHQTFTSRQTAGDYSSRMSNVDAVYSISRQLRLPVTDK